MNEALAGALADRSNLTAFEGREVLSAAIEIPNAAGGLRDSMKIDPQEFHHGEKRYVVLEIDVAKVRFDPVADTDGLRRVHVFNAVAATFVTEGLVREHLDAEAERILLAHEAANGIKRLPYGDELQEAHDQGAHAELVAGCPDCDAEADAASSEADATPDAPTPIAGRKSRRKVEG